MARVTLSATLHVVATLVAAAALATSSDAAPSPSVTQAPASTRPTARVEPEVERIWAEAMRHYERDAYAVAAAAFEKVTRLRPAEGTAWAMRGLCEFQLGRPDEALALIQKGRALGVNADPQFRTVLVYHEGLLLVGKGEFERAQETLAALGAAASDDVVLALGMSVMRVRPVDFDARGAALRDLVMKAGRAEQHAAAGELDRARGEYEALASAFPHVRNVQYALGRHFVATRRPEEAVAAFERELARFPDHVPAHLGIAAIKADTDPAAALARAEQAVTINPRVPLGHFLLGSLLLHTPDTTRAIAELELAEQSVKEDPRLYYALGRAYAKAGRAEDAARARARFRQLTEERQRAARRVQ